MERFELAVEDIVQFRALGGVALMAEEAARKEVVATPRRKTWYEWATGASSEADEAPVSLSALGGEIILSDEQVLMLTHTLTRTLTLRSYSRASRCSCS